MAELVPIPFDNLLKRIYYEYQKNDAVFDLPSRKFYRPDPDLDLSVSFCGNRAANPVGPAAGPQTQLTQNILLSWLAGSRILELKTIQIKDDLQLTRPCIDMATVGYNTEWSQELRLDQSLGEYVKAAMIIEMLTRWITGGGMRLGDPKDGYIPDAAKLKTIFDVSVGYDLAGIKSPQVKNWLETMRDASQLIEEYRQQIPEEFAAFRDIPFKKEVANSITLSTFHGCPANEIEKICEFLLTEMDYHVIIKMNPPMLGRDRLEYLLYEKLGYTDVEVNRKVYDVNITFEDAVDVVRRLETVASRCNKTIGVKFGNTLEVMNKGTFLKDNVQYLSGQPLNVLHLALVEQWRKVFGAEFPISFSAGVDANNFTDFVSTGLVPVTTCSDLLRPAGYGRLPHYLYNLERKMKEAGASTIEEFIVKSDLRTRIHHVAEEHHTLHIPHLTSSILANTSRVLVESINNPRYHSHQNKKYPRKIGSHLELWDCINCDKCIPACPNDANFYFTIEPFDIEYKNIEIERDTWREGDFGVYKVEEFHQIATFADACNECGNCDVFCPEDGGPYIEKPRFFGSLDAWKKWNSLSGFVLLREGNDIVLYGRFKDQEFSLRQVREKNVSEFAGNHFSLLIESDSHRIVSSKSTNGDAPVTVNMAYYFTMATLLKGMMSPDRIHFINVGVL